MMDQNGANLFDKMRQAGIGGAVIRPKSGWVCQDCGDEPYLAPTPPYPPGTPEAMSTTTVENPTPVYLCMLCYIKLLRGAVPHLVRKEDLQAQLVAEDESAG